MGCKTTCIETPLRKGFARLGRLIGQKPLPFLIAPPIVCLLLSIGLLNMQMETDIEVLFTPSNGAAKGEQKIVNRLFPFNYDGGFSPVRRPDFGHFITVILVNENGNVLSDEGKGIVKEIEGDVKAVVTSKNNTFDKICARFNEDCAYANPIDIIEYVNKWRFFEALIIPKYPITHTMAEFAPARFDMTFLGGVNTTNDGTITRAKVWLTIFFLREDDREFIDLSLESLLELNKSVVLRHPGAKLAVFTSLTLEQELLKTTVGVIPRFSFTVFLIVAFACVNCMLRDWVTSKPFMGAIGSLSAMLAIGASFGLLSASGVKLAPIVGASPFLVLAVGIDDMFVMLSAWRATDPAQAPHERLSHCMSDAAVSITITTVTDVLGFGIGGLIPFTAVQLFCLFTGVALAFTYFIQITFLAACMALDGRREAAKRHAITFQKIKPRSEAAQKPCAYRVFCTGGQDDSRSTMMTRFFRERFGPLLMRWQSRVVVMLLYVCYLAAAIYGVTTLEEGLELTALSNDESYSKLFFEMEYTYFRKYGEYVSVVVEAPLDYSTPADQARIEQLLGQFETNWCFHGSNLTVSWLRSFEKHQRSGKYRPGQSFDLDVRKFVNESSLDPLYYDVAFQGNSISATRYLVRLKNVDTTHKDKLCMQEARRIAAESDLDVTVFNLFYIHYDQFLYILPGTLQNLGAATLVMLLVSLCLIPDPVCSVWVVLAIVSIEVGVVGYMALWGVKLHSISMVCLIICIGFCVDFSAHITYAYSISKPPRIPNALGLLGVPIVQGGLSTLIGVLTLALFESPIFRFFFKIMFLVIVFGLLHGIVFLPVWLDIPSMCCRKRGREDRESEEENTKRKKTKEEKANAGTELKEMKPERENGHLESAEHKDSPLKERLLSDNSAGSDGAGVKTSSGESKKGLESNQQEQMDEEDRLLVGDDHASPDDVTVDTNPDNQIKV